MSTLGLEWRFIGAEFPSQFGIYIVLNTSQFEGSLLSISSESGFIFDVSLRRSENSTRDFLSISLPGLNTLEINLPDDVDIQDSSSFQRLGIRLRHYQLLVIVNCRVVSFVDLPQTSLPLPVSNGTLRVFENDVIVSIITY